MTLPDFNYQFADAKEGKSHTELTVTFPGNGASGSVSVRPSENMPESLLNEFMELGKPLGFSSGNLKNGAYVFTTPTPDGVASLFVKHMESNGWVKNAVPLFMEAMNFHVDRFEPGQGLKLKPGDPMLSQISEVRKLFAPSNGALTSKNPGDPASENKGNGVTVVDTSGQIFKG